MSPGFSTTAKATLAVALALTLPGCPLSDEYFVQTATGGTGGLGHDSHGGRQGREGHGAGIGGGGLGGSAATAGIGAGGCESATEVCDGVDNDCDDAIDEDGVCPAGCSASIRDDHLYLLCLPDAAEQKPHGEASTACNSYASMVPLVSGAAMDLVIIESADENTFLKDWITQTTGESGVVWMAANDIRMERQWVWGRAMGAMPFFTQGMMPGGMPVMDRFNDFAEGHPDGNGKNDQDCGAFDSTLDWQWDDEVCAEASLGFVCEEQP